MIVKAALNNHQSDLVKHFWLCSIAAKLCWELWRVRKSVLLHAHLVLIFAMFEHSKAGVVNMVMCIDVLGTHCRGRVGADEP
jgi:hypothetical protein